MQTVFLVFFNASLRGGGGGRGRNTIKTGVSKDFGTAGAMTFRGAGVEIESGHERVRIWSRGFDKK